MTLNVNRSVIVSTVLIVIIPMLVSGCGGEKRHYPPPPANAGANSCIMTPSSVQTGASASAADFGTITVYENRERGNSRLIHLPFIRVRSTSPHPREPIFFLSGGPGASNLSWDWERMLPLLSDHDIVAVGYRGVDGSSVLECPEVSRAFTSGGDVLGEESMRTIGRAWEESAARLLSKGIDLDGYTIPEVIEDNELVRSALGYHRILLLSWSYGTRVAYSYALRYPDVIRRSAMIGANPPGHFVWEPGMIDRQLRRYAQLWARDSLMVLKCGDLYACMRTVLNAMPRRWGVMPIDAGKVKVMTFCMLFHRSTAALVFDAFVAAEKGDPSGLALMSLAFDHIAPSIATWGDLASKAVGADFDSTRKYSLEMEPADLPLGSPLSKLYWGPLSYFRWPVRMLPESYHKPGRSDVETLILSGSLDFSTPADYAANELLPSLTHGRQIVFSEYGHCEDLMTLQAENTNRILTGFFKTGVPDTSMNSYRPMDFSVSWPLPFIMKAGFGMLIVVALGVIALIVRIVRSVW